MSETATILAAVLELKEDVGKLTQGMEGYHADRLNCRAEMGERVSVVEKDVKALDAVKENLEGSLKSIKWATRLFIATIPIGGAAGAIAAWLT